MSLKKQLGELDAKLKALRLKIKKCDEIIENRDKPPNHRTSTHFCRITGQEN